MIPLQLRVRNFMCYRDNVPTLDFEGIHLACLTGANGHGKSALLDAMTWAVWGKARAARDDELIHQGQTEMEVDYTFEVDGSVYRVLRKRESAKGGRTLLDLQVRHSGGWRSLSESTVRATQQSILRLLRMDYETFTQSAFLLQGRADAFTTRTPAERKQVLADILGLSLFDEYEQRTRDKARQRELQVAEADGLLREIDRDLAPLQEYESELALAEVRVAELSAAVKEAETGLRELRLEQQALEHQLVRQRDLERRLAQSEREQRECTAQIVERERRLISYEAVLSARLPIEQEYATLKAARQEEAAWGTILAQVVSLQGRQRELDQVVTAARGKLDLAAGRLAERIGELRRRAGVAPKHEQDAAELGTRLARLVERQVEREAIREAHRALSADTAGLKVRNEQIRADAEALKGRIKLLREAREAACPLCGQSLSDEHRENLINQFVREGEQLNETYRAHAALLRKAEAEARGLEAEAQSLDRELAELPGLQRREAQIEQSLSDAQKAAAELPAWQSELVALEERLRLGQIAPAEQAELAHLAEGLAALGYDAGAHQRARTEVAARADSEAAYGRLQLALERVDRDRADLTELRARLANLLEMHADDCQQRDALAAEVARLAHVTAQVHSAVRELEDLQAQSSKSRLSLGGARQKVDYCRSRASERERQARRRKELVEEKGLLDELRLAFGKKGIQAMIIEAAIPEIEFEANRLLGRMSDGRLNVRIETQRETLKGDPVETLDINIADELGTRPYELFSGGEAFRVNLAIRIALSRLLARRAGARLQMLVIDEGFGTQDTEGRERLVETITSIQEDFARILVVTHIEELKDAFPVRIEVAKTPHGSQVTLT